jgi:hypothetical protein
MAKSKARTPEEYLAELPEERREVIAKVRHVIKRNLPKGYHETMNWGMLSYEVPLERYPKTYNKQPLSYVGLAAQKNSYTLHLICAYSPKQRKILEDAFKKIGKKMDMGKACLHFKSVDDLPLQAIGKFIASVPVDKLLEIYEKARQSRGSCD